MSMVSLCTTCYMINFLTDSLPRFTNPLLRRCANFMVLLPRPEKTFLKFWLLQVAFPRHHRTRSRLARTIMYLQKSLSQTRFFFSFLFCPTTCNVPRLPLYNIYILRSSNLLLFSFSLFMFHRAFFGFFSFSLRCKSCETRNGQKFISPQLGRRFCYLPTQLKTVLCSYYSGTKRVFADHTKLQMAVTDNLETWLEQQQQKSECIKLLM